MCRGCAGSSSTSLRSREICTSIERSNTSYSRPRASSISLSRERGVRGCCASTLSTENSPVVSCTGLPSRSSVLVPRLSSNGPKRYSSIPAVGAPGGPAAPEHGVHAREQLARIEGLGQVVVGAHLQADDAVDVIALGGEHDDRGARVLRAQAPADRET